MTLTKKKIKIGIIGSGFGLYGLLPAFNSLKGCEVVAVTGKKTDRMKNYCESIGLSKIYSDWREMLDNEKLDAVAIAVVPSAQYDIAKAATEKGLHVFAEKPLTATYSQAEELFILARNKKIVTCVDFIFPEIEEWQKVKEILDKKLYGDLNHISVSWDFLSYDIKNKISSWKTDEKQGGGALSFYASHVLYYIEYFAGEITQAKTVLSYVDVSKNGGNTAVDIVFTCKNNISGNMHVSCNSPGLSKHRITFTCEKGVLVLESNAGVTENFALTVYSEKGEKLLNVKKDKSIVGEDERVRVVKKLAKKFINGCKTSNQVTPSFKEGLRVQSLIEKIRHGKE